MFVYFIITEEKPKRIKIGKSGNPEKRIKALQTGCPYKLKLLGSIKCKNNRDSINIEKAAHAFFGDYRVIGEWFKCTDFSLAKIHDFLIAQGNSRKEPPETSKEVKND